MRDRWIPKQRYAYMSSQESSSASTAAFFSAAGGSFFLRRSMRSSGHVVCSFNQGEMHSRSKT